MPIHQEQVTNNKGQALVLAVVTLGMCSALVLGFFQVSKAVQHKIRLQTTADMVVLSALNCQANALNSIALANRAILANDAMAGQMNALVSEVTFYKKLSEQFRRLLRFLPYVGIVSSFLSGAIHSLESVVKKITELSLPFAHYSNLVLRKEQEAWRFLIPVLSIRAARASLEENMPQATITLPSSALIWQQTRSLQKEFKNTESEVTGLLKTGTMDRHTLKRDWRVSIAGLSPVKKVGGTTVSGSDITAHDQLRLKTFSRFRWKWKTVLRSQSKTSDYRYRTPADLLSMRPDLPPSSLSFSIMLQSKIPALGAKYNFGERQIHALAAGRLFYLRKSKMTEKPNLFNPFWRTELIPVADEPNAVRIIPKILLQEVTH